MSMPAPEPYEKHHDQALPNCYCCATSVVAAAATAIAFERSIECARAEKLCRTTSACSTKSALRSAARHEPLASVIIIVIVCLLNPSLISYWHLQWFIILPLDGDILTYNILVVLLV